MTNLVNDIHAGIIDEVCELGFEAVEVVEDCFLKASAFGFDCWFNRVAFDDLKDLLFSDEHGRSHMVMILFHAGGATASIFPHAAVCRTEGCYLLTVLAFV